MFILTLVGDMTALNEKFNGLRIFTAVCAHSQQGALVNKRPSLNSRRSTVYLGLANDSAIHLHAIQKDAHLSRSEGRRHFAECAKPSV